MNEIDKIVSEFIWDGRGVRIAREVLENEFRDGALQLINLRRTLKQLALK